MIVMQNEECQDFETNTPTESRETNFLDDGRIKPKLTENSCIRSTTDATWRLDRGSATTKEQSCTNRDTSDNWLTGYTMQELKTLQIEDIHIGKVLK